MLEDTLKLDYAGIIALEKETETEYIRRGKNVLEQADKINDDFEYKSTLVNIKSKKRVGFPAKVSENMKEVFGIDNSWVPVYNMGVQWNASGYCCEAYLGGTRIPVLFYHRFFGKGCSTIYHEAIHAVRNFVSYSRFQRFEEAMADYNEIALWPKNFKPSLAIRKARKRLEDKLGDKAGHVLIRLTPPEVYMIASSKEPLTHLKEWSCLRHEIIKEKSGL
ncbi:MAG: hypothetical protein V1734_00290 [Nanoarchaeota archaeon]